MSALTLHGVRTEERGEIVDIAVADGAIAAIGTGLAPAAEAHQFGGAFAFGGFCESHVHLDKACILDRCSLKGGIKGAIDEVAALKAAFTEDDVAARAQEALTKCVLAGTQAMRTHVEIDPVVGLTGFRGVREAVRHLAHAVDVSLCVFPQDGLTNLPGTEELLDEALRAGADVIGACPYTDTDPNGQIDRIFALARKYDVDIDMHLDFSATGPLTIDHVIALTERFGWGGRVAVGHVTRFTTLPAKELDALTKRLADAGVAVTVLPATDLYLMHRDAPAGTDRPRGVVRVHDMAAAGVRASLSTNNILNPFTPYGDGSALRMANLYANIAQIGAPDELAACFEMVAGQSAALMGLPERRIEVGAPADIVVLDALGPADAVATLGAPLAAFKAGKLTVSRPRPVLHLPHRQAE